MNGEGVRYPAFLLGGPKAKFVACSGPEGLFVVDRYGPAVGGKMEDVLIDSSGRSWTLHAVADVGRSGAWNKVVGLWWKRRYLVEYEATEGPVLSIEEMRARLSDAASAMRKSQLRNREIDKEQRFWRLKRWDEVLQDIAAAKNFETVTPAMWLYSLPPDSWFSFDGRSNRAEYVSVMVPVILLMGSVWHFRFGDGNAVAFWTSLIVGFLLPGILGLAVVFRRLHDFGIGLVLSFIPLFAGFYWLAKEFAAGHLQVGERPGWAMIAVFGIFLSALAILPRIPGNNRFGPEPNPGPSL
jgi:uncharacterized membrane protein YhaH (DUF805 family)